MSIVACACVVFSLSHLICDNSKLAFIQLLSTDQSQNAFDISYFVSDFFDECWSDQRIMYARSSPIYEGETIILLFQNTGQIDVDR